MALITVVFGRFVPLLLAALLVACGGGGGGGVGSVAGDAGAHRLARGVKVNAIGGGSEEIMKELAARHLPAQ